MRTDGPKPKHPSVLDPNSKAVTMSYKQAIEYLTNSLADYPVPELSILPPIPFELIFYTPVGACLEHLNATHDLYAAHELFLTSETYLREFLTMIQKALDSVISFQFAKGTGKGEKLLAHVIEVRVGNKQNEDMGDGMPGIAGELQGEQDRALPDDEKNQVLNQTTEREIVTQWVKWPCNKGEVETFWDCFRSWMQAGGGMVKVPLVKVKTVKRVGITGEQLTGGGHYFDMTPEEPVEETKSEEEQLKVKPDDEIVQAIRYNLDQSGNRLDLGTPEALMAANILEGIKLEDDEAEDRDEEDLRVRAEKKVFDLYTSYLKQGGEPMKEIVQKTRGSKDKSRSVDPKRNWTYYQRMGGDPEAHARFPLGQFTFEVNDPVFVGPGDPDFPGVGDDQSTVARLEGTSNQPVVMVPYKPIVMPDEAPFKLAEEVARGVARHETAVGFDAQDDEIFLDKQVTSIRVQVPLQANSHSDLKRPAERPRPSEEVLRHNLEQFSRPPVNNAFNSPYLNSLAGSSRNFPPGLYTAENNIANKPRATEYSASPYLAPATTAVNPATATYDSPANNAINPAAAPFKALGKAFRASSSMPGSGPGSAANSPLLHKSIATLLRSDSPASKFPASNTTVYDNWGFGPQSLQSRQSSPVRQMYGTPQYSPQSYWPRQHSPTKQTLYPASKSFQMPTSGQPSATKQTFNFDFDFDPNGGAMLNFGNNFGSI